MSARVIIRSPRCGGGSALRDMPHLLAPESQEQTSAQRGHSGAAPGVRREVMKLRACVHQPDEHAERPELRGGKPQTLAVACEAVPPDGARWRRRIEGAPVRCDAGR